MKKLIRVVAFFAVFMLLFTTVSHYLAVGVDYNSANAIGGFYKEPKDSLDAVYIGSSNCLAFWNQMLAWGQHGIAVYPYACISQQLTAAQYAIKEVRKTQPNAAFVINVNTVGVETNTPSLHRLFDNMPFSSNKVEAIETLGDMYGLTKEQKKELYFPILRYHSRWSKLAADDFTNDRYKASFDHQPYWENSIDMTNIYSWEEGSLEPPAHALDSFKKLLDYCDQEKLRVVFVTVPRKGHLGNEDKMLAYINNLAKERGYKTLELTDKVDALELDLKHDYYNRTHTNVHGSAKFTDYVAKFLIQEFGFEDKRGNPDYQSWDTAYDAYTERASQYLLDFEVSCDKRDNTIKEVRDLAVTYKGYADITFTASEGATGYAVFKRMGTANSWVRLGETATTQFTDPNCEAESKCYYIVVPFYEKDGKKVYGNFDPKGIDFIVRKSQFAKFEKDPTSP